MRTKLPQNMYVKILAAALDLQEAVHISRWPLVHHHLAQYQAVGVMTKSRDLVAE